MNNGFQFKISFDAIVIISGAHTQLFHLVSQVGAIQLRQPGGFADISARLLEQLRKSASCKASFLPSTPRCGWSPLRTRFPVMTFRKAAISWRRRRVIFRRARFLSQWWIRASAASAGGLITDSQKFKRSAVVLREGRIRGEIMHRDRFGNLITNIAAPVLAKAGWCTGMDLDFTVGLQTARAKLDDRYSSVPKGDFVMLLNSQGLLEIARHLDAAAILDAAAGDTVEVRTAGSSPANSTEDTANTAPVKVVSPTTKS